MASAVQAKSGLDLRAPTGDLMSGLEPGFDLVGILSSTKETAYAWDLVSDRISWESNAAQVLGLESAEAVATGAAFELMIASEHVALRGQALREAPIPEPGCGSPYRVQYRFLPSSTRSRSLLWLEDHGRLWYGSSGEPVKARGIVRVISERSLEQQRRLYRSDYDELTGQLNRARLTDALGSVIERASRLGTSAALLAISVNNLAIINDTFGYDVGDEVIAEIGRLIRAKLRVGDIIGRYSSNKFGVVLANCGIADMRNAAERFLKAANGTTIRTSACPLTATISIGGVLLPSQAETVAQAMSHAMRALENARSRYGGGFLAYEQDIVRDSLRRRNVQIADEVLSALEEHRMRLALQPIVDARSHEVGFSECLLRLERRDGQLVSAGEFIQVAEQLGLSRLIDRRTLELAVGLIERDDALALSVNVSSLTTHDREWLLGLERLIAGRRNLAHRLIIEITETAAIGEIDRTVAFVDSLRELGCRVAIDDFGAGYTSFKNLKHLAADIVKIDGAFVRNLAEDATDRVFIKTMVELARSFEMTTVAEWVGDAETARICTDCGVDLLQGFHFGEPRLASRPER
jgi:diguanylate cyclase (GGDEF)-like protein